MINIDALLVQTDKWVFCHIPKNGGANFKREFRISRNIPIVKYDWEKQMINHQLSSWWEKNYSIRNKQWICISRNPYSRYVSWFFFIRKRQKESNTTHWSNVTFEDFVRNNMLENSQKHRKYKESNEWRTWNPSDPQSHWITPNMKVFSLETQLEEMEDYTKTKFAHKRYNSTEHAPWPEYYTQEIADIVYDRYKIDFDTLHYSKDI